MTAYDKGAFQFSARTGALVVPDLPSLRISKPKSNVEVNFAISHAEPLVPLSYAVGSTTYLTDFNYTPIDTLITFTATASVSDADVLEYKWNFGDGTEGWGNPVTHEYSAWIDDGYGNYNYSVQAVLRIRDSLGRKFYARQQIYLSNP